MKARVDEKSRVILSTEAKNKLRLEKGEEFNVILLSDKDILLTANYGISDSKTEFVEEIKKVAKKMGIETKEEKNDPIDTTIRKNGKIIGFDAEKMREFYAFKTNLEATGFIKGKVMTSKLCSCECEGYIVWFNKMG